MAHEDMDKLSIAFKHLMLDMDEKELEHNYEVSVADIADLMETLQSCLLRYKEYDPQASYDEAMKAKQEEDSAAEKGAKVGSLASKAADKVLGRKKNAGKENKSKDDDSDEPKLFRKRPICFLVDEASSKAQSQDLQARLTFHSATSSQLWSATRYRSKCSWILY